jgi:anti-anti-sigma factor
MLFTALSITAAAWGTAVAEKLVLVVQRVRWQDGVVVLAVSGELDVFTARLDGELLALSGAGHHRIVLDVAGLGFCDAPGLGVLIRARGRAERRLAAPGGRGAPGCPGCWRSRA